MMRIASGDLLEIGKFLPVAADSLHMARKIAWGPSKVKHGCATILPTPVCGQRARSAPLSPPPRRHRPLPPRPPPPHPERYAAAAPRHRLRSQRRRVEPVQKSNDRTRHFIVGDGLAKHAAHRGAAHRRRGAGRCRRGRARNGAVAQRVRRTKLDAHWGKVQRFRVPIPANRLLARR